MKPTTMARWSMALAVATLACGCGRNADQVRAGHAAHAQAKAGADRTASAAAAAAAVEADFVSAVSSASSAAPVTLRFRMQQPPRVGQPLQLELVLSQQPGVDIDSMLVSFQPGEGLQLQSDHSFEFRSPVPGATQRMNLTLTADQAGVLSLGATVLVDSANTSVARYFLIPLIAMAPAPPAQ
jgi:hypothetical protein